MRKKKITKVFEVEPVDNSPRGLAELQHILEALFADLNACETEEDAIRYIKEYLSKPKEEQNRETLAIIKDAKKSFKRKNDC